MSDDAQQTPENLARAMIDGEVGFVEGCRDLVRLHRLLGNADDDAILTIIGFESETDDFPVGEARAHWTPEALADLDRQRGEYETEARDALLAALSAIAGEDNT